MLLIKTIYSCRYIGMLNYLQGLYEINGIRILTTSLLFTHKQAIHTKNISAHLFCLLFLSIMWAANRRKLLLLTHSRWLLSINQTIFSTYSRMCFHKPRNSISSIWYIVRMLHVIHFSLYNIIYLLDSAIIVYHYVFFLKFLLEIQRPVVFFCTHLGAPLDE